MKQRIELFSLLNSLSIEHTTVEHSPLFTVADAQSLPEKIPGAQTKNLFLKDDRQQLWLISALETTQINLRQLSKNLPAKNLRFAQPEFLRHYLNVEPGSVTWFALLYDKTNHVKALLDKTIFNYDLVGFHPFENTATTLVKPLALIQFAEALEHHYQIYEF